MNADSERIQKILELTRASSAKLQSQLKERQESKDGAQRPTAAQLRSRLAKNRDYEEIVGKALIKAKQQKEIINGRRDFEGLLFALTTFKNLEQIRFMRVMDPVDAGWVKFLKTHPEHSSALGNFEWNLAWEHSAKTLSEAFIKSNCQSVNRLSSRFIDPQTPCMDHMLIFFS